MDLLGLLQNYLHKAVGKDDAGNYYPAGAAQTRLTRTPMQITSAMDYPEDQGEYLSDGTIRVHPDTPDPGNIVRHESIHALLDPLADQQSIVQNAPNYNTIANGIHAMSTHNDDRYKEAVAYMGAAPYSQIRGVTDDQHDEFLKNVQQQLMAAHPQVGQIFQRLLDSGRKPTPPPVNPVASGQ